MVAVYILHYICKHFAIAIHIEEANSLAQILCTKNSLKVHCTQIKNKFHVAFDIQAIDVCVVYGFLYKNIELKKHTKSKKNY